MVNVNDCLLDAMGDVIKVSLLYHYSLDENICHTYNFDDVIKSLYKYLGQLLKSSLSLYPSFYLFHL